MKIKDLFGYQLVSIDNCKIVVKKGDSFYTLLIEEYSGDCCGFNELETRLLISNHELNRNPVITNVVVEQNENCDCDGDSAKITFFGEFRPIAELESYSSSGSGWCYGACVTIQCKELDIAEAITEW